MHWNNSNFPNFMHPTQLQFNNNNNNNNSADDNNNNNT
jgi:hypothetical protein